ncbi:MAG: response regulator transcription factor [Clostridia bacterium]|nr:response regulator transcription factor [Clostridia bacterium]
MIYEPHEATRALILSALGSIVDGKISPVRMSTSVSTASAADMQRAINSESGISLSILSLERTPSDNRANAIKLGQLAIKKNRDNYTLFCVHDPSDLETLLTHCMRPAGILISPFDESRIVACLKRILEDYSALSGDDGVEDSLVIESGSSTYRLPYSEIVYFEALDKKINICTSRQQLTVRKALSSLSDTLPEKFLRCHRAFIVNADQIERAEFSDMTLYLRNGETLPISRGCRDQLKQYFDEKRGGGA